MLLDEKRNKIMICFNSKWRINENIKRKIPNKNVNVKIKKVIHFFHSNFSKKTIACVMYKYRLKLVFHSN